ncbi:hypothetical protein LO762_10860 [Actinocorallia sp. API 0066]|uniref:CATRA system-associated protein n=1 Tax=Actinocorallia sp. API 0066 TaxID=2896846 RepID=UPI001E634373|nr:CATRA system-associated protein [Actinocorallia sp. API 0066]MCD0449686.1 hypothetical protein [Actinocorallia sp. API 0066]
MGHGVTAEQRERVLFFLPDIADWPLPEASWERVNGLLAALEDAALSDDGAEFGRLTRALEAVSPPRAHARVSEQRAEPPAPVRERLNRLREILAGAPEEEPGDDAG